MTSFLEAVLSWVLFLGVLAILGIAVVAVIEWFLERREIQRRAEDEAYRVAMAAMNSASTIRRAAWQTRRAMHDLDPDVIDVEAEE